MSDLHCKVSRERAQLLLLSAIQSNRSYAPIALRRSLALCLLFLLVCACLLVCHFTVVLAALVDWLAYGCIAAMEHKQ
jgi:hypothetical protein